MSVREQAIEFLADPDKPAREYKADNGVDVGVYFTLGYAKGLIGSLLDELGASKLGPDKWTLWRMEWDAARPFPDASSPVAVAGDREASGGHPALSPTATGPNNGGAL